MEISSVTKTPVEENANNIVNDEKKPLNENGYASRKTNWNNDAIAMMFEKKFHYQRVRSSVWKLQPAEKLFSEYYQWDDLQQLKEKLNRVKSKLNDYSIEEWSAHTRKKDPAGEIPWRLKNETQAEFVTIAWCKIFECLHRFPLVKDPKLNTLHLCEAPGAFIAALNHYLYSNYAHDRVHWNWFSTTMNPYYEGNPLGKMIIDDRFMLYTLDHWLFHEDFTGNIINRENVEHMEKTCASRLKNGVQLITADGSIDCIEVPDCQEEYVSSLHFAECVAALSILADGGNFVIKMFTLYEAASVSQMYLLNCSFDEVHVYKPSTSKCGNSEVYVVCLGYKKNTQYLPETLSRMKKALAEGKTNVFPLFAKSHLPKDFLLQHEICVRIFMNYQIQAIESNIYTYKYDNPHTTRNAHLLRTQVCHEFYKRYRVEAIPETFKILYHQRANINIGYKQTAYIGSYTERKMQQNSNITEQIFMLTSQLNELEKSLCKPHGLLYDKNVDCTVEHELQLYKGAAIVNVDSSLFATMHVMLLRTKFKNIFNIDPLWNGSPMCAINDQCIVTFETAKADYSFVQQKFFELILNGILEHRPHQVKFYNFPFLTHYAVSVLHYVLHIAFLRLSIDANDAASKSTITLNTDPIKYSTQAIEKLTELRDLLKNNANMLCILNITKLHRNEFSKALTEYNNLLLLKNFRHMLNI